jgi:hypothetical protein
MDHGGWEDGLPSQAVTHSQVQQNDGVGCEERPSNSIISTPTYRNSYPKALSGLSVEHVTRPFAALPVHSGNDRRHTLTVSKSREKKYK